MSTTLLHQLKRIINEIDDSQNIQKCPNPPCSLIEPPYLQVCIPTQPCCAAPTEPQYVKPLQLPEVICKPMQPQYDIDWHVNNRSANFYNYYMTDYKKPIITKRVIHRKPCEDYTRRKEVICDNTEPCPTGFKPCEMKLCPPTDCHPNWKAVVIPCPPRCPPRRSKYVPQECTRPGCHHWKPKDGYCIYDKPCKAHCYDVPIGMKATHFF